MGAAVEMPVGGLTTLTKTIASKPDQVRRVIKSLAGGKRSTAQFQRKISRVHRQSDENGPRNRDRERYDLMARRLGRQRRADTQRAWTTS